MRANRPHRDALIAAVDVPAPSYHPARVLVRFRSQTAAVDEDHSIAAIPGAKRAHNFHRIPGLTVVDVQEGGVEKALKQLRQNPAVMYAEPDFVVHVSALPNDEGFPYQWALQNTGQVTNGDPGTPGADLNVVAAWDYWTGDPNFRIAIIDTGVDYTHSDLAANIWTNPGEIPGNNIDDDGNGYIDDVHGYNTEYDNGDPMDDNGHGTHVAGTIGAVSNNFYILTGVNWHCSLVPIKFANRYGDGYLSDAIEAIEYALANDIRISNNSWGCNRCVSQALEDVVAQASAAGHLMIAAAGNGYSGVGLNADDFPDFPASYDYPTILSVGATDNDDQRAGFSNFSPNRVHLGAPGVGILSLMPGESWAYMDGTSMATANVTGVAALLWSRLPQLSAQDVRQRLLYTARKVPGLESAFVTGGVVDALAAVADCNANGVLDDDDISAGTSADCNGNLLPDECEPDCDGDGVPDDCELAAGTSQDCNGNKIPDECEADCNGNGRADECDVGDGTSLDCNDNGIPDECEPGHDLDCNDTGTPDLCDIADGRSVDCNGNGIPDECDNVSGASEDCTLNGVPDECERDCNGNGVADSCDLLVGTSRDVDFDGIPDECMSGFSVAPVSASGPHAFDGNDIILPRAGGTVTFELRVSGWDVGLTGDALIRTYQVDLDPASFTSGDAGTLALATIACENNDDCLASSICQGNGTCDANAAWNVDPSHPDFLFGDTPALAAASVASLRLGATIVSLDGAARDVGTSKYVGTLVLQVPPDGKGVFEIGLLPTSFILLDGTCSASSDCPSGFLCLNNNLCTTHNVGTRSARVVVLADCNDNGIDDDVDIATGTSLDCNGNLVPDECLEYEHDCNNNGVPDACDVSAGTSADCNSNGLPDECEDCNGNGIADACDLWARTSEDCNGNGIPDECLGLERDCDGNGVPDECDLAADPASDADGDGNLDRCRRTLRVPSEYATIQAAVDAADPGDVVLLSAGTYTGIGNLDIDFHGKNLTIRGESGPELTIIDCQSQGRAFYFHSRESRFAHIEGLTIQRGLADSGGAVYCDGASPTFSDCVFRENLAVASGGAMYVGIDSGPSVTNCEYVSNSVIGGSGVDFPAGAAIYSYESEGLQIDSCQFSYNLAGSPSNGSARYSGAAIAELSCLNTEICNSSFQHNVGKWTVTVGEAPLISGCTITSNDAAGLSFFGRYGNLIESTIVAGNKGDLSAGGVSAVGNVALDNCLIAGNTAPEGAGGGLTTSADSKLLLHSCTICGNEAVLCGGIYVLGTGSGSGLQIANTIISGNKSQDSLQIGGAGTNNLIISNSLIEGGWRGEGNFDGDPGFVSPGYWDADEWVEGDYRLAPGSIAINAGDNELVSGVGEHDLDGHQRIMCGAVDVGAYEFGAGDFNCDRRVTVEDVAGWEICATGPGAVAIFPGCQTLDLNGDNAIDLTDVALFQTTIAK